MILAYWKFISRVSYGEYPGGFTLVPNMVQATGMWTLFFIALMQLSPIILSRVFPKWYKNLGEKKQHELPSYVASQFHHCALTPLAWYVIYEDTLLPNYDNGMVDYKFFFSIAGPACTAYLLADTICFAAGQALKGLPEYFIHHIFTLWMIYALFHAPGRMYKFFPHLLAADTCNIFFNLAWFLRSAGYRGSPVTSACEMLFAIGFFFLRAINLATCMSLLFYHGETAIGPGRYSLLPIIFLQWYWFSKIFATAFGLNGKKTKKEKKEEKKIAKDAKEKKEAVAKKD